MRVIFAIEDFAESLWLLRLEANYKSIVSYSRSKLRSSLSNDLQEKTETVQIYYNRIAGRSPGIAGLAYFVFLVTKGLTPKMKIISNKE